jgi:4-aminobutyrate aminotransferase
MMNKLAGAGPIGRGIIERDAKSLSSSFLREYALVVDRACGSEVWDVDGKRYIDFMAGVAVMNVGHRHPKVQAAIEEQLDKFWHICLADFYYPQAVELAEKLQAIAPMTNGSRVYFGNSGTEAVEAAVKLAQYKTGRNQFIGFIGAFHGRTLGALAFTASRHVQRGRYMTSLPVKHIPYPNAYRQFLATQPGEMDYGETVINYMEDLIFSRLTDPNDIAGILIEPIQGEGGYIVPPPGFFKRLRQMCDRYGIMLILDEVQSGAGRTGNWWAIEHEGVDPDIICFAKGIGSGLPIGGIIAREEHMVWEPGSHGSTFGGNPVAAAAALATLSVIENEGLLAKARQTGQHMMDGVAEMEMRHPSIGDIRGRGLMIGIEFVHDRTTKRRARDIRDHTIQWAFEHGLLLIPCGENSLRLTPSLNIPQELVNEGLLILEQAISAAEDRFLN